MNLPKYDLDYQDVPIRFEFLSEGLNGKIEKIVIYSEINQDPHIFNLGFGDKDVITGEISDTVNSNNGDRDKVLATVAFTAYIFTNHYPNAWIYMEGSTPARTRLYQMAINSFYTEIVEDFAVLGLNGEDWIDFKKNTSYSAFLIKRKK